MSRTATALADGLYRLAVVCLLVVIALTVLIGVVFFALGLESDLAGRVFGSACLSVLACAVFVAAGTVMRRGRLRTVMVLSIASIIISTTGLLEVIWSQSRLAPEGQACLGVGAPDTRSEARVAAERDA